MFDELVPEPADIHSVSAREQQDPLPELRGAGKAVGTADRNLVGQAHDGRSAGGASLRHDKTAFLTAAHGDVDAEYLRNDLSGLADTGEIADPYILSLDLVHIVKARPPDDAPGDLDRIEIRDGRENARPPDGNDDIPDARHLLFRRVLERDGPPRGFRRHAEPRPQRGIVDLDHNAVGHIREVETPAPLLLHEVENIMPRGACPVRALRGKAHIRKPLQRIRLQPEIRRRVIAGPDQIVEKGRKPPLRRDFRVQLAQTARGRVSRVREERFSGLLANPVEFFKRFL